MGVSEGTADAAGIAALIESGSSPHLHPIWIAVRDFGCRHGIVTANAGPFAPPTDRPCILFIGDDLDGEPPDGPLAFHRPSLRRYARTCRAAMIVATEPVVQVYAAAAREATVERRNVLIVETRLEKEADWYNCLLDVNPRLSITLSTSAAGSA